MNITLSADKSLIEKTRKYAKKHHTTLNNLIRDYMKKLVNASDALQNVSEFEEIAKSHAGKSPVGYKFNREDIYTRKNR